jgi:NADPH-dependent curcumin reductase CurA
LGAATVIDRYKNEKSRRNSLSVAQSLKKLPDGTVRMILHALGMSTKTSIRVYAEVAAKDASDPKQSLTRWASHVVPGRISSRAARMRGGLMTFGCQEEEENMSLKNRQVLLASRPTGEPTPENFRLVEAEIIPRPGPGQMLVRTLYLSLDPYMRGRMNAGPSYAKPVEVGEVMEGRAVAEVVESNLTGYKPGDLVLARTGWQEYALSDGKEARKVDPSLGPVTYALGVLGMPGLTAYTGLLTIGRPKPGETVVVAAASGAVGSLVGQIAKIKGCRAVGIAGGEKKCRYVKEELGFDAYLNHRDPSFPERLKEACPSCIDVYFENVGGKVFDAVLPLLNNFARVPVCGLVAQYNQTEPPAGPDGVPALMMATLVKRLAFRGFIVWDFAEQFPQFLADMSGWLKQGKVKYREDITDGLENAPRELIGLLKGQNFGKKIIRVGSVAG